MDTSVGGKDPALGCCRSLRRCRDRRRRSMSRAQTSALSADCPTPPCFLELNGCATIAQPPTPYPIESSVTPVPLGYCGYAKPSPTTPHVCVVLRPHRISCSSR